MYSIATIDGATTVLPRWWIAAQSPSLHREHEVSDTEFLVDGVGYLTPLVRRELSGHHNYSERNHIENCPFRRDKATEQARRR